MSLLPEYTLRGHQSSAVETALKRDGNVLFSHPVGSGKTLTSIATFEALKEKGLGSRALVVTPASLRENYGENGVKKFTNSDYRVYGNKQEIASDSSGRYSEPSTSGPEYGVVSYELFRENPEKYIQGHGADTVIFDEVHRLKNDTSKTYSSLKNSRKLFRNFIGMTGSIVSNTPADVVPLIDAMTEGNHKLGSKSSFENRFVSVDKDGNKTVVNPVLVRALLAPYVHHVTEDQVSEGVGLKKPQKIVKEVIVPLSGEHEDLYRYAINELDPITKAKLAHGLGKIGKAELDALFSKLLKSRQVANSISTLNKEVSLEDSAERSLKVKKLLDDVQDHLRDVPDAQVVVHSELINGGIDVLEAGLKKRGILYGKFLGKGNEGVTEKARQQDVKDYNEGRKKVILISSAGGEGLDLPNTTMVASLDGHWNPEKINQVEARGIRMGGLSHRPEADRKVLVNRYITKLPISKLDALKETKRLIDPSEILLRAVSGEKLFYNPIKNIPTVDEMMYQVAKNKAHGNSQLTDLFEKTSAFSVASDKRILSDYLEKYQDQLLTGDYANGAYIDPEGENKYIQKLKSYYDSANKKDVIRIKPKEADELEGRSRLRHAVTNFAKGAGPSLILTPLIAPQVPLTIGRAIKEGRIGEAAGWGGVLLAGASVGGVLSAKAGDKLHVVTTAAEAKKRSKLSDEELLRLLRGESISTEKVIRKDHFIRMK